MIHSVLVEKLNKHIFLQCLLCFLPVIFVVIYVATYIVSVTQVLGVLAYNDSITKQNMDIGVLKEVADYTENKDGTYNLTIVGDTVCELDVELGSPIYYVYAISSDWFQLVTSSEPNSAYVSVCNFVDSIKDTGSGVVYSKNGLYYKLNSGDLLLTVVLDEDGSYKIDYSNPNIEDEVVDSLETLEVELATEKGYRFKFHSGYNLDVKKMDINFCSNLPTNNIYYNETTKSFVRNVSEDFPKNFILGSNMLTVLYSMICLCVMLFLVSLKKELVVLSRKTVLVCNIASLILLPICVLFTFAVL